MTVQTYSLDAATVQDRWPQTVEINDASGPLTTARVEALIASACSIVNGILSSAGIDPDTVNADAQARTAAIEYVYAALLPEILRVQREDADAIRDADDAARSALGRLRSSPRIIGVVVTVSLGPGVTTSTSSLGLDTDEASMLQRRRYASGRRSTPGRNRFHW